MSRLISGGLASAGAGRRITLRESGTFLSSLGEFCRLLDAQQLSGPLKPSALASVLMSVEYFALPGKPDRARSFMPVCGGTWGQGMEALLELAKRASSWAAGRGIDPQHERLEQLWNEAIGLAWAAETTARCHLMPAPYMAWEAGMLLSAAAMCEQLRLLDIEEEARPARLGQSAIRQIESLVIQNDFASSLSLVSTVRKSTYLGPWPAVSLAYRLSQRQSSFAWSEGVLDMVETLPTSPVMEACVVKQLQSQWKQVQELACRAWRAGIVAIGK